MNYTAIRTRDLALIEQSDRAIQAFLNRYGYLPKTIWVDRQLWSAIWVEVTRGRISENGTIYFPRVTEVVCMGMKVYER